MSWSTIISVVAVLENPSALIALVSIVALLVVAQCVRTICNAITKGKK